MVKACLCLLWGLLATGCASSFGRSDPVSTLHVPEQMQAPLRPDGGSGARYTVRMAEAGRVWELEWPEEDGAYELRIPLEDASAAARWRAEQPLVPRPAGTYSADGGSLLAARAGAPGYLAGLSRVKSLYSTRQFELALLEVAELERHYPEDPRLWAMKGTLYSRIGRGNLARQAWQKAAELDPSDLTVAEALDAIEGE